MDAKLGVLDYTVMMGHCRRKRFSVFASMSDVLPVLALTTFFLLAAPTAHAADEADFVIGTAVSLSGVSARAGQEQLRGLQQWVDEVNARGGLFGRKLKLMHYDDGGDAQASAKAVEKLIVEDKAVMVVGPNSLDATSAAAATTQKYGVAMIAPGVLAKGVWEQGYKTVFGLYSPAETSMDAILAFAKSKGLRRIALVYQNTVLPREMAEGVKSKVGTYGMYVVFEQAYDRTTTDFGAMVGTIKLKRPDVILAGSYLPDSVAFMHQVKDSKLSAKIMSLAMGAGMPEFGSSLGSDAEGVLGVTQWESTLKLPGAAEFTRSYRTKHGQVAGFHAAAGYAAGQVLEAAAKRAGSMERERLRKALFELDTTTIFGRFKVDGVGRQIGKSAYVVQWLEGERVPVLPTEVTTGKIIYPFKSWNKR